MLGATTLNVNLLDTVTPAAFAAVNVYSVAALASVGVPEIAPVFGAISIPAGRSGDTVQFVATNVLGPTARVVVA
jgi:hypothetical protein